MSRKALIKKITGIATTVLMYLFLALCIFSLFVTILSKRDPDGAANVFGYQMRTVLTDSMAKCEMTDVSDYGIGAIPKNSLIFIELLPEDLAEQEKFYADLEVGDVLTFKYLYTTQLTITHRIIDISPKTGGGYLIVLEGDNKDSDTHLMQQYIDTTVEDSPNYVIGRVRGQFYPLGLLLSIIKQPVGLAFIVIVPCAIIMILEIIKVVSLLGADKKKKQDDEIEALKRQLAELQAKTEEASAEAKAPAEAETPIETDASTEAQPVDLPESPAEEEAAVQEPALPEEDADPNSKGDPLNE